MRPEIEQRTVRLAAQQFSLIARWQALDVGMTPAEIRTKLANGSWRRVARGLYEVTGSRGGWRRSVMARVLGAGRNAVASHLAAARLHELIAFEPEVVDIVVPATRHPKPLPAQRIHPVRSLEKIDTARVDGIPVTSVPRTLVDLASILTDERLEAVVDTALVSGRTSIAAMRRYLAASGRKWNVERLVRLLDDREFGVPESELERAFERLIRRARLPMPVRQRLVARFRVDYAYPELNLVIEVDGSATRSTKAQLQRDRRRQNEIVLAHRAPVRFTWDDVTTDVPYVIETLRRAREGAGGGS